MPSHQAGLSVRDGRLRSGDQASVDADGYVRITGRIKDLIIRGGENVAPGEGLLNQRREVARRR